jgi:hypothetical protein
MKKEDLNKENVEGVFKKESYSEKIVEKPAVNKSNARLISPLRFSTQSPIIHLKHQSWLAAHTGFR